MDATRPVSYDLSDYLGMVRRHWWLALLFAVIGGGGGLAFAHTRPQVYQSTASVLVMPVGQQDTNAVGGRTNASINLDTEAQLVTSTEVATAAAQALKVATPPGQLAGDVVVAVPPNTTVLTITYSAGTAKAAQAGARAFATAYLQNRQNGAQADLTAQVAALDAKLKQLSATVSQLSGRIATMRSGDPGKAALNSQINSLTSEISTLAGRETELGATTVTAGKIISDAPLPAVPSQPSKPLFVASGGLAGLLVGVGMAALRQRTDRKPRRPVDVPRRCGVPVLGLLPRRPRPRFDDVFPPNGPAGRMFSRLRNEVLASLGPDGKVVVVTGVSRGASATVVAANLAGALARAGSEVVLVCAQPPESLNQVPPAAGMFDVAAVPGLSDVLAGKVPLVDVVQRAPRLPWLRVITAGGTATAGGLLQSQSVREIITALRAEADHVVIEAPSTAAGADAQSLASHADAAILAVELRRTRHAEILDAAEQVQRVGTQLLGAVVLPRLRRVPRIRREAARAVAATAGEETPRAVRAGTDQARALLAGPADGAARTKQDQAPAADCGPVPAGLAKGAPARAATSLGDEVTVLIQRVEGPAEG